MNEPLGNDARAPKARVLVVSLWETVWSLGVDVDIKAGVSDDYRFIEGFTRAGYELHFLRPAPRSAVPADARVHTHSYPNFLRPSSGLPTWIRRPLWPLLYLLIVTPRALQLARKLRVDIIIGHSYYSSMTTWWCRKRLRLPVIVKLFGVMDLVHTEWPPFKYWLKNFEQLVALKFSQDAWIVLDDGTRGGEILRSRGVSAAKVHFLPNGLNVEWADLAIDRAASRVRIFVPNGALVVLFLARLVPSKRPRDFIRAAAIVLRHTNSIFVVAGDGFERRACEDIARDEGIMDRVRFLGSIPHDDVPLVMAAADAFVSTSSLTNRALPTCEAMLCGIPVVAYDTGDTRTIVRDNDTGLVVQDGDIDALAAAIERLLGAADDRARMSNNARRVARETFTSWNMRIAMEMKIVDELIGR